jgi:phage head maturation protease
MTILVSFGVHQYPTARLAFRAEIVDAVVGLFQHQVNDCIFIQSAVEVSTFYDSQGLNAKDDVGRQQEVAPFSPAGAPLQRH